VAALKFLLLLVLLGVIVYFVPLLWELGLVGAIGGAIWIFAWPKAGKPSKSAPPDC